MNIKDNGNKRMPIKHKLGEIYRRGSDLLLLAVDTANGDYFFVNLSDNTLQEDGYDSLERVDKECPMDELVNATLEIYSNNKQKE